MRASAKLCSLLRIEHPLSARRWPGVPARPGWPRRCRAPEAWASSAARTRRRSRSSSGAGRFGRGPTGPSESTSSPKSPGGRRSSRADAGAPAAHPHRAGAPATRGPHAGPTHAGRAARRGRRERCDRVQHHLRPPLRPAARAAEARGPGDHGDRQHGRGGTADRRGGIRLGGCPGKRGRRAPGDLRRQLRTWAGRHDGARPPGGRRRARSGGGRGGNHGRAGLGGRRGARRRRRAAGLGVPRGRRVRHHPRLQGRGARRDRRRNDRDPRLLRAGGPRARDPLPHDGGGEAGDHPAYPLQNALTRPMRAAANRAGRAELLSLWAGQAARLARRAPAAEIVRWLVGDAARVRASLQAS